MRIGVCNSKKILNFVSIIKLIIMGKGDKKTRRGKITNGSYGKTRQKKASKSVVVVEKQAKAKPEKVAPEKEVKPKAAKPKAEKPEEITEEKPKTTRKKKTEE